MVVSERKGKWVVTRLDLDHNHPMQPGAKYFRAHKRYDRPREEDDTDTKRVQYTNKKDDVLVIIPSGWPGSNTL
jgi:hypothetical protein